jgi:ABC-type Fe2+-enterobactin transport system substrate-binding protein
MGRSTHVTENRSEVARLLAQIGVEYEAEERGLKGLAAGTARHEFINHRMERIRELHASLHSLVGEGAMLLIAGQIEAIPDAQEQAATADAPERGT